MHSIRNQFSIEVSLSFQKAYDGELETLISELRKIPDSYLGSKEDETSTRLRVHSEDRPPGLANPHLPLKRSMMEVLLNNYAVPASQNKPFQDGKPWVIKDDASLSAAHGTMRSTLMTPSSVSVEGSDLDEREMSDFLALVSKTRCRLSLRHLDTFWRPSPRILIRGFYLRSISMHSTRSTLFSLMKPEVR